jgi:hypothetical protein
MNIQQIRDNCKYKVQQGDVIIRQVTGDIDNLIPVDGDVVMQSAHPHIVKGGTLYKDDSNNLVCIVEKKATFIHKKSGDKHANVSVPKGVYFIEPIVEIDFLSDMVRPVAD